MELCEVRRALRLGAVLRRVGERPDLHLRDLSFAEYRVAKLDCRVNYAGGSLTIDGLDLRERGYGRIVNLSSGAGQLTEMGSGFPAYRISKSALNALTRITAAELGAHEIKVNSVCPGWVRTDMGGPHATRTVEHGAETAVWLATLPEDGPTGGFFRDMKPIPW